MSKTEKGCQFAAFFLNYFGQVKTILGFALGGQQL